MELEPISEGQLESLAVFPLPATVLFPGTALPLHVFEPRYLQMVKDALEHERPVGIVMLKDTFDGSEPAPIYDVACASRIVHAETLGDGRMNVLVQGVQRVRLERELPAGKLYRQFKASQIPKPDKRSMEDASSELARLQSCVLSLRTSVAQTDKQLVEVLGTTSDPIQLADILSAVLVHEPPKRQDMLSTTNLRTRLSKLIDAVAEVMVKVGEPPQKARMN